ncbi:MAG: hypothetical protein IJA26_08490, partial [Clostridia bacterium]|nr:hypothetical protein [Clostridia bacterium]
LTAEESSGSDIQFEMSGKNYDESDAAQMHAYVCENCGAELVTDENTTATECAYCGSPAVIPAQIEGGPKPEKVIPFLISKEQAKKMFEDYFKGKKLMPNIFLNTRNRIAEMRKLFVPYWLFDCDAYANITYNAQKTTTTRSGDYIIHRTRHYLVRRAGSLGFDNIPVDGSVRLDNKIGESLEPYDLSKAVDFKPAVLAGALADKADVDAEECRKRAVERVENSISQAMRNTVNGYTSVTTRSGSIKSTDGKITPVLMPVWLITTEKVIDGQKKVYTFAINGQTGELTCDVPHAKGKAAAWFFGVFLGVAAIGILIVVLLSMMGVF